MSDTPETDAAVIASGDWSPVLRAVSQRLERERDEALMDRANGDIATMTINHYERILRERDEAREERDKLQIMRNEVVAANKGAKINAQVSNSLAGKLNQAERERDEARKEIENVKLQLRLWEDGNLICEETLGEIRLFEEQIKQALLERNKAYKIAEQAIEDLAWFNETNAQRLRTELEQLKETK